MMAKRVLFISTLNLATNPRILKEIKLANALDYDISFLGFHLGNWSDELDKEIRKQVPKANYTYLEASRINFLPWLRDSLLERVNRIFWKLQTKNLRLSATAHTKRTFSLLKFANKVKRMDFDLVIGHTLGTFYPASIIARKAGCPYAFDIEDFHPGEHIEGDSKDEISRRELIMNRTFLDAAYISASSPLIGKYSKELCGLDEKKIIPILNFFYSDEFRPPVTPVSSKIQLIWFSQFIGPGRGLEIVLSHWDSLKEYFELTLIGTASVSLDGMFQAGIRIIPPLPQRELHQMLGSFDVGLAFELTNRDINRDIALTNKLLAYFQAGLYILTTDTAAQVDFMKQNPNAGMSFSQISPESFLNAMKDIRNNITQIRLGSLKRYENAVNHNWEKESEKLREIWNQILN